MKLETELAFLKINAARIYAGGWITECLRNSSPEDILKKDPLELSFETGISVQKAASFLEKAGSFDAVSEMEKIRKAGYSVFFFSQEGYPECFLNIPDPPAAFYVRGKFETFTSLAVVGTRKVDEYGIKQTEKITFGVASAGLAIVSGLARGVDTLAHRAALKAGGRTAAVIGSGLDNIYPPENRKLASEICESGGFILSEYPLNEPPLKINFPLRNRLISALSWGVLVIEGDYPSGSLITARHALSQGREVMAVPGRVDNPLSNGPNKLIKEGAIPVASWQDVLDAMPSRLAVEFTPAKQKPEIDRSSELKGELKKIYLLISKNQGVNSDELSCACSFAVSKVLNLLFELETAGLVAQRAGRYYTVD